MNIDPMINELIRKSLDGIDLNAEEISTLFQVPLFSADSAQILAASRTKSQTCNQGLAEVHAQMGINISPCPRNCKFCAFASNNHLFTEKIDFPQEVVIARAKEFEQDGANAIFLMATGDYSFGRFIETAQAVRSALKPESILVANVGDFSQEQAKRLKEAGFSGVYHAVRLGEGRDTKIPVEARFKTFAHAREAGLNLGTCLEPVGKEHTVEELVEKTLITRDAKPVYSGSARRIAIPGTELAKHGNVSEAKMAHILAVVRLALGYDIPGNCTHEPNALGATAGANLFWAEVGSNPRDPVGETEKARGMSVADCRRIFAEAEYPVLDGPSSFYGT